MGRAGAGRAACAVVVGFTLALLWWLMPVVLAGTADAVAQDVVVPEVVVHDVIAPDVMAPEVVVEEVWVPEAAVAEVWAPEAVGGEVWAPEVAAPEAAPQNFLVRVPILTYHNVDYSGLEYSVTPEQLHAQCLWLVENGYTAITLWQFWDAVTSGTTLPPNPVLLTNDDGWSSAMTFAEIIGQYGLVGNYFVTNVSELTPDQILALSQWGTVQAHTANHTSLAGLAFETQLAEISQNKAYIEGITGQTVMFLAWPYGASDASAAEAAAAAGMVAAFGLGGTAAQIGAVDPYHIPRIMMGGGDLDLFASAVTGW
jgi:hypothetical protein